MKNTHNTSSLHEMLDQPLSDAAHERKDLLLPMMHHRLAQGARQRRAVRTAALVVPVMVLCAGSVAMWMQMHKPALPIDDPTPIAVDHTNTDVHPFIEPASDNRVAPSQTPGYRIIHTSADIRDRVRLLTDDELIEALREMGTPAGLIRKNGVTFLSTEFAPDDESTDSPAHHGGT